MRARRDELGLTQDGAANRYGPSSATLRLIEAAVDRDYRQKSLRELEESLEWEPGSVHAIGAGREPMPRQSPRARLWATPEPPAAEQSPAGGVLPTGEGIFNVVAVLMMASGGSPAEVAEFARNLGLPGRDSLTREEWDEVAHRIGLSSTAVIANVARFASAGATTDVLPGGLRKYFDGSTEYYVPEGEDPQEYIAARRRSERAAG